jgi:8-oxo-dGTP diphosphatase
MYSHSLEIPVISIPCVAIIVENPRKEVLLLLRDDKPGVEFANHWTLPGGLVEANETPIQAAYRELYEETGLVLPLSQWRVYERHHQSQNYLIEQYVFTGRTDREDFRLVPGEGQELRYFGRKDIASLPIAYEFGRLLEEFFSKQ